MFDSTSHQQWHTSDDQTASCSQVLVATNENFGWTEALLLEAIQRDSSRQIDYLLKMKGLILISNRNYIHVACLVVLKLLEVAILLANPFGMISFDGTGPLILVRNQHCNVSCPVFLKRKTDSKNFPQEHKS